MKHYPPGTLCGRLVAVVKAGDGRVVSKEAIMAAVYGNRSDGGPESADSCLAVMAWRLRHDGYPIYGVRGGGTNSGGYYWKDPAIHARA